MRRYEAAAATAACVWMMATSAGAQECIPPSATRLTECTPRARASGERRAPRVRAETPARGAPATPDIFVLEQRSPFAESGRRRQVALLERERDVLRRLLARQPRGDQHADVLDRMAMTLEELIQARRARAGELEESIFRARRQSAARARSLLAEQRNEQRALAEHRTELIETLAVRVRDHRDHRGTDQTLFALAFYLEEIGQHDRARQVYRRIVRDHPDSDRVPHAYLAFAEHAFAGGELGRAREFYERVLTIEASRNPVYGYALYKLAWVHQNLGDSRAALQSFVQVIEHTRAYPDRASSASLARQVRRELVLPYASVGRPDRALAFFRRIACPTGERPACVAEARGILDSLGTHYQGQGQWADAIATRQRSMQEEPGSSRLCEWQLDVFEASLASRPPAEQLAEARRTLALRRTFAEAHPDEASACTGRVAEGVLLLATAWHREAIGSDDAPGTRSTETMARAGALYARIESELPPLRSVSMPSVVAADRPTPAQLAAWRGDLAYEQQRWDTCASAYSSALSAADDDSQLAADAAYGAVLCFDRQLGERAPMARSDSTERRDLTEDESRMVNAFQRFSCVAPEDEDLPVVLYRWAQVLYGANRFDEAAVLYRRVALEHPGSEVGEFAANLYLDSLNAMIQLRDRSSCEPVLRAALDPLRERYDCEAAPELCTVLTGLTCTLAGREAEALSRAGAHGEAARQLLAMLREHGDGCPARDRMLFNVAIYFERANLVGRAIRVRAVLIEQYPESALSARALHANALSYHAIALYEQAADHYERYAAASGRCTEEAGLDACPDGAEGLRDAVLFRLSLGQAEAAQANVRRLERTHRRAHPELVAEAVFAMGRVGPVADDPAAQARHYRGFLRRFGEQATPSQRAQALLRIGRGHLEAGQRARALETFREVVAQRAPGEAALAEDGPEVARERVLLRDAVSEAHFELAEALRERYDALAFPRLRGSASVSRVNQWASEALRPWVLEKMALLEEAASAYREVGRLGMPRWQIAAASRQGDMVMDLVEQVRDSPVPTSIARDPELLSAYLDALDDVAAPYEEVAIAGYERCLETATRARWFDERSRRCEEALHELDAARFPIASELRGEPTYRPASAARPSAVSL